MCCCCCRFSCGAPTTDERIHAPVLHDASQNAYCRYWGRASLPPITSKSMPASTSGTKSPFCINTIQLFNFIILRPRPRTYASTSPLLLLQLHQQQQLLSINIINSTNHHLQHAKLRILLQHLTSHAAYERSGGPPKRPAAKRPCTYLRSANRYTLTTFPEHMINSLPFRFLTSRKR